VAPHVPGDIDLSLLHATWSLVLQDLTSVAFLIAARFAPGHFDGVVHAPAPPTVATAEVSTPARRIASPFEFSSVRSCMIAGRRRHVPSAVFDAFRALAHQLHIEFPVETAFLDPGPGPWQVPTVDCRILDAFVAHPSMGIARTLAVFRGQTTASRRPNPALRPWLYREHLPTYPELELLCNIADHGVRPTWRSSDRRTGVRPVPANYQGAVTGSNVVNNKLLADFFKGRCIIASMPTLVAEPSFHSSAFALVPKKDIPLQIDGRTIHNLSAPVGASVNDLTDSTASPDATWDPFVSIAQRVCDLRRRYPGYAIYGLGADIADAFHHVPVHEADASAFGGNLPRTDVGIVSGMAVFGWTASPGFFAVLGKAVRHYQRTGGSHVLGFHEPFWIFQWVDDIVLIEVDIDDRLQLAEQRLRDGVKLVFGSDGWHEGKFTTWSQHFHAVGIDWNIPEELITVPQRKIDKVKRVVSEALSKQFITKKRLDSIIGILRHVIGFVPITKPFIQRLTAKQLMCSRLQTPGVTMNPFLRKDLEWWNDLVFQHEFAGMPMKLFNAHPVWDECWHVELRPEGVLITSMSLRQRCTFFAEKREHKDTGARALSRVTAVWGPALAHKDTWCHVVIVSNQRWVTEMVRKMNSQTVAGQDWLRQCALSQARHRLHFETHTRQSMTRIRSCDVHTDTDNIDVSQETGSIASQEKRASSNERQWPDPHLVNTRRTSGSGSRSATTSVSRYGSTNCRKRNRREWSDYSPACVRSKATTGTNAATSTRPLTEKWQQLSSPTRRSGTGGSITKIQNLSSSLKDTNGPTVTWTGSSQLLHKCCSRCDSA
jgi:hypothetical protein